MTDTLTAALTEGLKLLASRTDAEGVSVIPRTDGGLDIRLIDKPLYVTLEELSARLPSRPSVRVLRNTCDEIGVKVGRIGAKACVSIEAFKKAMEASG